MLHVVTVHWQSAEWVELQLQHLERHCPSEFEVWASLDGIDVQDDRIAHPVALGDLGHADKLNRLAAMVAARAEPSDHLLFLDGDAFPVRPLAPFLRCPEPLVAVRRDENVGDPQPHPCFALTTVGWWGEVDGDWRAGYEWPNASGRMVSDVGGNLLGIVRAREVRWRALTRMNTVNLHPLWFGVYGDQELGPVAYHHGAGFRVRWSRSDMDRTYRRRRVPAGLPVIGALEQRLRERVDRRAKEEAMRDGQRLHLQVRAELERGDDVVERFVR